ncbi:hypothetical protein CAEBREN_18148 [Caenorhabditis brenneri]|uniref:SPK domain-containing protein n=1 Tax=Caenorhabditis brenneri TaxID=135651 RepID=G0N2X8_CAEBE|nr:hypothetical protein CAEBREN_18148 [Caenorhabditis brenneri]
MVKLSVERKAENEALVELFAEKCEEAEHPLNIDHEIKKFIETRGSDTHLNALKTFVQQYKETVRKITDKGKRARQLFCLGVFIHEDLMKEKKSGLRSKVLTQDSNLLVLTKVLWKLRRRGSDNAGAYHRYKKKEAVMLSSNPFG